MDMQAFLFTVQIIAVCTHILCSHILVCIVICGEVIIDLPSLIVKQFHKESVCDGAVFKVVLALFNCFLLLDVIFYTTVDRKAGRTFF